MAKLCYAKDEINCQLQLKDCNIVLLICKHNMELLRLAEIALLRALLVELPA